MRITVLGAGAMGGLIAARLSDRDDHQVTLVSRRPLDGLRLQDSHGTREAAVVVASSPGDLEVCDWLIVATKVYDVETLTSWMDVLVGDSTLVAVAQNGIGHAERVASHAPQERVLPLILTHGAQRTEPGLVVHTLQGEVKVPDTAVGRAFQAIADGVGLSVVVVEDFERALWTKLAWNLVGNSLSTIADLPVREVGLRPELRELAVELVAECTAAAAEEGVRLDPGLADEIVDTMAGYSDAVRSSMWQDLHAGRRLEHEAISGAVERVAARHGVAAPYSRMATRLLGSLSPT